MKILDSVKHFFHHVETYEPKGETGYVLHGTSFPFKKGVVLKVLDDVILAFPQQLINNDEKLQDVINAPDDAEFSFAEKEEIMYLKLKAYMNISLNRSCEVIVISPTQTRVYFEIVSK